MVPQGSLTQKDLQYLKLVRLIGESSKCLRARYGALIVKNGRIIATGYNGKPHGAINDHLCYREGLEDNAPKPNCCIHAEVNALLHSSPDERKGATMYVSGIPCTDCALLIMQSGITRLICDQRGPQTHQGNSTLDFWREYGFDKKIEIITVVEPIEDITTQGA